MAKHMSPSVTTTSKSCLTMNRKLYYEMCKERRGNWRCFVYGWFGDLAYNYRNKKVVAARETRGEESKNRWEALRSYVMRYGIVL